MQGGRLGRWGGQVMSGGSGYTCSFIFIITLLLYDNLFWVLLL